MLRHSLLVDVPPPDGIRAARQAAGLTLAAAAELVGLGHSSRWAEYESGRKRPDAARWALFLLATGQHPGAVVIDAPRAA